MAERKVLHLDQTSNCEQILQKWVDKGYKIENLALSSCCTQYAYKFLDLIAVLVKEEQQSDKT